MSEPKPGRRRLLSLEFAPPLGGNDYALTRISVNGEKANRVTKITNALAGESFLWKRSDPIPALALFFVESYLKLRLPNPQIEHLTVPKTLDVIPLWTGELDEDNRPSQGHAYGKITSLVDNRFKSNLFLLRLFYSSKFRSNIEGDYSAPL